MIRFDNERQRRCYERLAAWLAERPEAAIAPTDAPMFILQAGSAAVAIEVTATDADLVLVGVWSYVATGVRLDPDLLAYLLAENQKLEFCGFALDEDNDILLQAELLDTCTAAELHFAVDRVLAWADTYDDWIVAVWGGKRAVDVVFKQRALPGGPMSQRAIWGRTGWGRVGDRPALEYGK
ncbi:MAG: YbjN domain-containing protein [Oscillatoriales cyanobacterium SM2_1_8]|nr:YbjN domain-containing protein [Oscillatoriales cyanobacterium SM2_1_8]